MRAGRGGATPSEAGSALTRASAFSTATSRDALGINEAGYGVAELSGLPPAARRRLEAERKMAIEAQLGMLPAPQNE